jgi:hypothetical protein
MNVIKEVEKYDQACVLQSVVQVVNIAKVF